MGNTRRAFSEWRPQAKLTLNMNLMEIIAKKKAKRHEKVNSGVIMTIPGSEFFWNPKAKLRTRKVQSVVNQMKERR